MRQRRAEHDLRDAAAGACPQEGVRVWCERHTLGKVCSPPLFQSQGSSMLGLFRKPDAVGADLLDGACDSKCEQQKHNDPGGCLMSRVSV